MGMEARVPHGEDIVGVDIRVGIMEVKDMGIMRGEEEEVVEEALAESICRRLLGGLARRRAWLVG
jgi:hypothetical protein